MWSGLTRYQLGRSHFWHVAFFFLVDCQPYFTRTPSSTNKVYVDEGDYSFALSWDYYSNRQIVHWVDLMYKSPSSGDVLIARKTANKDLQVSPTSGYNGRITFTGRATFTLWYIKQSDRRTFECTVHFDSMLFPWIKSTVDLIVVGKSLNQISIGFIINGFRCTQRYVFWIWSGSYASYVLKQ